MKDTTSAVRNKLAAFESADWYVKPRYRDEPFKRVYLMDEEEQGFQYREGPTKPAGFSDDY